MRRRNQTQFNARRHISKYCIPDAVGRGVVFSPSPLGPGATTSGKSFETLPLGVEGLVSSFGQRVVLSPSHPGIFCGAVDAVCAGGQRRASDIHHRMVGLRRLEPLLLHGPVGHSQALGWTSTEVAIKVQRFDYAASLEAFVAKNIDACTMTNMEALDMPAAAGVDSTSVIIGDYSNGNDAVLARGNLTLAQLPGKPILLVQKTVSEYLLERAMDINGLNGQLNRLKLLNTSDSDIVGAFLGDKNNQIAVTWKPLVSGDSGAGFGSERVVRLVARSGRDSRSAGCAQ